MNYSQFQQQLESLQVDTGATEIHGQLCGLLCTSREEIAKGRWFATVLEDFKSRPGALTDNAAASAAALQELDELFVETCNQLSSEDFGFSLFVSPSSTAPFDRMGELAEWCNGFIFGFGLGAGEVSAELPTDTAELIKDFTEISRFQSDDDILQEDHDIDQDENDVMEIEEFIRVGVLLINEEMQALLPDPAKQQKNLSNTDDGSPTLH